MQRSTQWISIVTDDISDLRCDMLILKYADNHYGADLDISAKIGFDKSVAKDKWKIVDVPLSNRQVGAETVLFLGVGPLSKFRYEEIRKFGCKALKIAASSNRSVRRVGTTIHGPGYGLDERESFLSLVAGFVEAFHDESVFESIDSVTIVEKNARRADHLIRILENYDVAQKPEGQENINGEFAALLLKSFGRKSEQKLTLFIAMPFRESFDDEWQAIVEAGEKIGFKMERLDVEPFVGDIVSEIRARIENCAARQDKQPAIERLAGRRACGG